MSLPPVTPDRTAAGIALDPKTLERVVPESRRPDGSLRKEIRIRPGFTPQEDISRFRGTRQKEMDRNALPKGHILGWVAPSGASKPKPVDEAGASMSKSAKKNEKRKEKRDKKKEDIIRANWEDDNDRVPAAKKKHANKSTQTPLTDAASTNVEETEHSQLDNTNETAAAVDNLTVETKQSQPDGTNNETAALENLTKQLEQVKIK